MHPDCQAALLLSFDIDEPLQAEHDDWHAHEHLPERLGIAGFVRGSRWKTTAAAPRYAVLYEVRTLAVLESPAYLERLNQPSEWTRRMMPAYRGMRRGLCRILATAGAGLGAEALVLRMGAAPGQAEALRAALGPAHLQALVCRPGLVAADLLEGAAQASMTAEQRLRGADAGVDLALMVTGYDATALDALAAGALGADALQALGAREVQAQRLRLAQVLTATERPLAWP